MPGGSLRQGGLRSASRPLSLLLIGLALSLLASCATTSRVAFGGSGLPLTERMAGLLPEDALIYGSVRVDRERALVSDAFKQGRLGAAADIATTRTSSLVFAISQVAGGGLEYFVVASGDYPVGTIGFRLASSGAWKREGGNPTVFRNLESGMELAFPSRSLALLSNGNLAGMLARYGSPTLPIRYPAALRAMEGADLAAYAPRVGAWIAGSGGDPARFPAQSVLVSVVDTGASFRASAQLVMQDERAARLFSVIFRILIAGSGGSPNGPVSFAHAGLSVQGSRIDLENLTIERSGLADLLGQILSGRLPRLSAGGIGA